MIESLFNSTARDSSTWVEIAAIITKQIQSLWDSAFQPYNRGVNSDVTPIASIS